MPALKKGNDEILVYGFDWENWLAGDVISTSVWVVPPGLVSEQENFSQTVTTIKLSGGTVEEIYEVTNIITTTDSDETAERTMRVQVVSDKYK